MQSNWIMPVSKVACAALIASIVSFPVDAESLLWTKGDLKGLIEKWQARDGVASFVVSDAFCEFAMARPELFLKTMSANTKVLNEWTADLSDLSFVNRGGCLDRECLRLLLIESLETVQVSGEVDELRRRLLEQLSAITVRRVD